MPWPLSPQHDDPDLSGTQSEGETQAQSQASEDKGAVTQEKIKIN